MALERFKKILPSPPSKASKDYALFSFLAGGASFCGVIIHSDFFVVLYGLVSGYFAICTMTHWKAGARETTGKIHGPSKPENEEIILPYNLTLSRK